MDLKSNHTAPVLTNSMPNNARLGIYNALLPYSRPGAVFSPGLFLNIPRKRPWLLEEVRSTSWLDAMKSSSPTHKKKAKDSSNESALTDNDDAYLNWMLNFPSAIASFEKITNFARGKRIALFLDYDGTLSPIVDNPDHAFISKAMRAAVKSVAKYFPTAIISGRSRDKVHKFIGLNELYYAGSHGMDIMGPVRSSISDDHLNCLEKLYLSCRTGKEVNLFQPASDFLPMIDEVLKSLIEITKEIEGAYSWTMIAQRVNGILKNYPCLRLTHGWKVLEVRPVLDWDKGKAVGFLLKSLDDRTGEDAFKVLREGNRGYGILVSSMPKESNALKDEFKSYVQEAVKVQFQDFQLAIQGTMQNMMADLNRGSPHMTTPRSEFASNSIHRSCNLAQNLDNVFTPSSVERPSRSDFGKVPFHSDWYEEFVSA
ncbi:hypothetical protein LguiA_012643 [Lonicera macranthoides]